MPMALFDPPPSVVIWRIPFTLSQMKARPPSTPGAATISDSPTTTLLSLMSCAKDVWPPSVPMSLSPDASDQTKARRVLLKPSATPVAKLVALTASGDALLQPCGMMSVICPSFQKKACADGDPVTSDSPTTLPQLLIANALLRAPPSVPRSVIV